MKAEGGLEREKGANEKGEGWGQVVLGRYEEGRPMQMYEQVIMEALINTLTKTSENKQQIKSVSPPTGVRVLLCIPGLNSLCSVALVSLELLAILLHWSSPCTPSLVRLLAAAKRAESKASSSSTQCWWSH